MQNNMSTSWKTEDKDKQISSNFKWDLHEVNLNYRIWQIMLTNEKKQNILHESDTYKVSHVYLGFRVYVHKIVL